MPNSIAFTSPTKLFELLHTGTFNSTGLDRCPLKYIGAAPPVGGFPKAELSGLNPGGRTIANGRTEVNLVIFSDFCGVFQLWDRIPPKSFSKSKNEVDHVMATYVGHLLHFSNNF